MSNLERTIMADILVVDDDDVIRDTLCELLVSRNTRVKQPTPPKKRWQSWKHNRFDVVLTDISMPGLSGKELLNRVVELYPGTPVIMISGLSDQEQAQSLISLGRFRLLVEAVSVGSGGGKREARD